MFIIDQNKMHQMAGIPPRSVGATDLCREGRAFFVGGALPIQETLETMFESDCEASTELFVVTFGDGSMVRQGIEMVRALKKNFNMRLMVRVDHRFPEDLYGQAYAAGADLADLSPASTEHLSGVTHKGTGLPAAIAAFPRWSVASTVVIDGEKRGAAAIEELLDAGVVPLPRVVWNGTSETEKEITDILHLLLKSWRRHKVAIKPFAALIALNSPLVQTHKPGTLRSLFDRLHYRRELAASDLLRHLRVSAPADSLDSAAL